MIHDTQSGQMSQKQDECNVYAIIKTICPPAITRMTTNKYQRKGLGIRGRPAMKRSKQYI